MNRIILYALRYRLLINRLTENVEHTSKSILAYRYGNRCSGSNCIHPTNKSVGRSHCDTAYRIVTQMLGNLYNQFSTVFAGDFNCVVDFRKICLAEPDIKYGADNLCNLSYGCFLHGFFSLQIIRLTHWLRR